MQKGMANSSSSAKEEWHGPKPREPYLRIDCNLSEVVALGAPLAAVAGTLQIPGKGQNSERNNVSRP